MALRPLTASAQRSCRYLSSFSNPSRCLSTSMTSRKEATKSSNIIDNNMTHTGQQFSEDDIRMARFLQREKQVNSNWAIDLIKEVPPKVVDKRVVSCDGGGGALGHPRVYINLDTHDPVSCIYCGLRYVLKDHH